MTNQKELTIERFRPVLSEESLEQLAFRLNLHRASRSNFREWGQGVPGFWLDELITDWRSFDTTKLQATLDAFSHFQAEIDGLKIHAVVEVGKGPSPIPILLTHGWPGSFMEYLKLLPLLVNPQAFGGDPEDSFTVVVPSLPGFGFSSPPPEQGFTPFEVAKLWQRLMVDGLGFAEYVAHGSDLGAGVTAQLARNFPESVSAIHLATPAIPRPPEPWSDLTTQYFKKVDDWTAEEGGYMHMQSTKPSTVSAALRDSPVGLAAWIGEKMVTWSDTNNIGESTFDREFLLSTLTLYWTTDTIHSSFLPYWNFRHNVGSGLVADSQGPTPTAISVFGGEIVPFAKPPRDLASRYFNLSHWFEHEHGGHFPAVAEPALLAKSLREVFRPMRKLRT